MWVRRKGKRGGRSGREEGSGSEGRVLENLSSDEISHRSVTAFSEGRYRGSVNN